MNDCPLNIPGGSAKDMRYYFEDLTEEQKEDAEIILSGELVCTTIDGEFEKYRRIRNTPELLEALHEKRQMSRNYF